MGAFGFNRDDKSTKKMQRAAKKSIRQEKSRLRAKNRFARRENYDAGVGIFNIVILLLIIVSLINVMQGRREIPTFFSFLNFLQTCPVFDLNMLSIDLLNSSQVGCSAGWISVANVLIQILNALTFLGVGILNSAIIIIWFLQWLLW